MQGDLLYVRVETLEGHVLHVTATPCAFFVNRCSDEAPFDPAPAQPGHSSRTLWALMHRVSPAFRKAYQQVRGTTGRASYGGILARLYVWT